MTRKTNHSQTYPNAEERPKQTDSCFSKSICSANDCTGLIPAMPSSEAEQEAYEEMYQFCIDAVSADASEANKQKEPD